MKVVDDTEEKEFQRYHGMNIQALQSCDDVKARDFKVESSTRLVLHVLCREFKLVTLQYQTSPRAVSAVPMASMVPLLEQYSVAIW